MDPSDSLAPPAPGEIGVRVEILPDVFVEMETVRRIHALLLLLVTLIALWFRGQSALRLALVKRPILPPIPEVAAAPPPPLRPASELHFLEGFARARKRAVEVLQYAITTAPPALRTRCVELAGDPAAPLDPGRFRLKLSCTPTDETVVHAFLENLRVLLPQVAVVSDEADLVTRIDSGASPQVAQVEPASVAPLGATAAPAPARPGAPVRIEAPSGGVIEIGGAIEVGGPPAPSPAAPARPAAPPPGLVRTADGGALITAVVSDDATDPLPAAPARAFPRATAVPAPDRGRLVPLFAAPKTADEEPEDGESE